MWNITISNKKCNEFDKIRDHRLHLERLITSKARLDQTTPNKPSFLMYKAKKLKMEEGIFFLNFNF